MTKTYTGEQIEFELTTREMPDDVARELALARMRETCAQYALEPHPLWLSFTGKITLAQIIAAKLGGLHSAAEELEQQWLAWVREQE